MSDAWFKPKTHGYGASPANWKGWAAMAAYVGGTAAMTVPLMVVPSLDHDGPALWQLALWVVLFCVATSTFVRLARGKTAGEWRWRWGESEQNQ